MLNVPDDENTMEWFRTSRPEVASLKERRKRVRDVLFADGWMLDQAKKNKRLQLFLKPQQGGMAELSIITPVSSEKTTLIYKMHGQEEKRVIHLGACDPVQLRNAALMLEQNIMIDEVMADCGFLSSEKYLSYYPADDVFAFTFELRPEKSPELSAKLVAIWEMFENERVIQLERVDEMTEAALKTAVRKASEGLLANAKRMSRARSMVLELIIQRT